MARNNVVTYYDILKTYNGYRKIKDKRVCRICFKGNCDHGVSSISRKDGLLALQYFTDLAMIRAKDQMIWLDDDIVIPEIPFGKYNNNVKYTISPRLSLPMSVVHVDDVINVFTGTEKVSCKLPNLVNKATHYGYIVENTFYSLISFNYGNFFHPNKIKRLRDGLPNNDTTIGFFYLLKGNNNYEDFARVSCIL